MDRYVFAVGQIDPTATRSISGNLNPNYSDAAFDTLDGVSMKVYFVSHDGVETVAEGVAGESLMAAAVAAGVPGIDASCGGACSCATCMVYVDEHWSPFLPPQSDMEVVMLLMSPYHNDLSRLSCQITLNNGHAGLRVKVPETQL